MYELLKTLTACFGPSGRETAVADTIMEILRGKGLSPRKDALGNVIVRVGGSGKRLVFMAHMDSVGLMLTGIDKDGFGRFSALGWLDPAMIAHTPVVFENGQRAVICIKDDKVGKELKLTDLYLDFGTADRAATEKLVTIGDSAAYVPRYFEAGDSVMSTFLDNRSGCAILLAAIDRMKHLPNEVYLVFSVQEEVGTRGAGPSAYGLEGAYGIAVDVTAVDDVPGSVYDGSAALGKGAGIKILDHAVLCHPDLILALEQAAEREGIPCQKDIMTGGGTDGGAMAQAGRGMAVGGISLPCRYTHAPVEVCRKSDFAACVQLAAAIAETEL